MNEKLKQYSLKFKEYYKSMAKWQKGVLFGGLGFIIILLLVISFLSNSDKLVPLYNELSLQEVGQIKEELDARSIPYELTEAGTTIEVPEEQAESLLVDLAAQGIPDSGSIDYSFFAENSSWGVTDNEFDVMKLDAMQTEIANLISQVNGIKSAEVMINVPKVLFLSVISNKRHPHLLSFNQSRGINLNQVKLIPCITLFLNLYQIYQLRILSSWIKI